jgi:hypothetical protein
MLIILIAHIPSNSWASWIPARFGFSDATEIFVFCSGLASALAFGPVFDREGFAEGSLRIARRIWQVYWVHVAAFIATVALLAFADEALGTDRYLRHGLNLGAFLDDPGRRILGFVTLTYVPNYFDILPMYLVILALVPLMMAAARIGLAIVVSITVGLWVLAALGLLELPADRATGRAWFFNPFSWQLLFFIGFAFGRGWVRPKRCDPWLVFLAVGVAVLAAPVSCHYGFSCHVGWGTFPWLGDVHRALFPFIDKTHLGILRIAHFLAIASIAQLAVGSRSPVLGSPLGLVLQLVGRQTLAAFVAGLLLAQALGVVLDITGRALGTVALANLGGCALLVGVAGFVEWLKSPPRSGRPAPVPVETGGPNARRPALPGAGALVSQ